MEKGMQNPSEKSGLPKSKLKSKNAIKIAAMVNGGPWSDELKSSLSPLLAALSNRAFLQALSLISSPSRALRFFRFSLRHSPHTLPPSSPLLLLRLHLYRHPRLLLSAVHHLLPSLPRPLLSDRLFNFLLRSLSSSNLLPLALRTFHLMPSLGVHPTAFTYNSLLSALLRRGRTSLASSLYRHMLLRRIPPDACTYNTLIRGFCRNSMLDDAFRLFNDMSASPSPPDLITYNTLVDGLCRCGRVRIAHNFLNGMLAKPPHLRPNVVTYTTVLRGYCGKRMVSDALQVFKQMVGSGIRPNSITCNTLVQGLCEAGELDKAREVLRGVMEDREFHPDTCTFNTLMTAHCNDGKLEEALKMFAKMPKLKVKPDSATYSILIRCLCLNGDYERAEALLDELAKEKILLQSDGCVPLVAAYNPIFKHLCAHGKTSKAEKVFQQLLKRGTQDPPAFKTLILGHCREGTLRGGYEIMELMLQRDLLPDVETYNSLIDGFLQKGESSFACKTLEKMLKSEHLPKTTTFHETLAALIRDGCAQEAGGVVKLMLDRRIRQNVNLSTETLIVLFKTGLKNTAQEVVRLLYNHGYYVKMENLVSFLCGRKKFSDAKDLLLFSLEKRGNLDIEIYSTVVMGLCRTRRASEAFSLYYELTEKGRVLSPSCLTDLKIALEADGRFKEADFVSKRILRCQP